MLWLMVKTGPLCFTMCFVNQSETNTSRQNLTERHMLASMVASRLLRRYRVMRVCRDNTGISQPRLARRTYSAVITHNCKPHASKASRLRSTVSEFLQRDDISRIITSKADTVIRHGQKKQRRLLTDTLTRPYMPISKQNILQLKSVAQHVARFVHFGLCSPLHGTDNRVYAKCMKTEIKS